MSQLHYLPLTLLLTLNAICCLAEELVLLAGPTMGTTYSLKMELETSANVTDIHKHVEARLAEYDAIFSTYRPDSEITLLNAADSHVPIPVSPHLGQLLALSREINTKTQGHFDVSLGAAIGLWQTAAQNNQLPSDAAVNDLRNKCGQVNWELSQKTSTVLKKHAQLQFNLNGIAPGYVVDVLSQELIEKYHPERLLLEIGGEIRAINQPGTTDWQIKLESPSGISSEDEHIALSNNAVAMSGDYRHFFTIEKQTFGHILQPATLRPHPYEQSAVAVELLVHDSTVKFPCAHADAYATALFTLSNAEKAMFAQQQELQIYNFPSHRMTHATENYVADAVVRPANYSSVRFRWMLRVFIFSLAVLVAIWFWRKLPT